MAGRMMVILKLFVACLFEFDSGVRGAVFDFHTQYVFARTTQAHKQQQQPPPSGGDVTTAHARSHTHTNVLACNRLCFCLACDVT